MVCSHCLIVAKLTRMLHAGKEHIHISFEKEDATQMSYEDNAFEVVVSYGTLHHISSLQARQNFIRETCRVASQKVIIADFNEAGFPHTSGEYKIVDFDWLKSALSPSGKIEKHEADRMNLYVCSKTGNLG